MKPSDFIKNFKIKKEVMNFIKARGPGDPPSAPKAAPLTTKVGASPGSSTRSLPVGTIHGDRQKVSMNPPKWVHIGTGRSFDSHDTHPTEHHKLENHEQLGKVFKEAVSKIKNILSSEDMDKGEKLLRDWLEESIKYKNFFAATNAESVRMGGGIPKELQNKTYEASDNARKKKETFKTFLQEAKKRANAINSGKKDEQEKR